MGQTWLHLLFAHWRVPPERMARLPAPLDVDATLIIKRAAELASRISRCTEDRAPQSQHIDERTIQRR